MRRGMGVSLQEHQGNYEILDDAKVEQRWSKGGVKVEQRGGERWNDSSMLKEG